MAGVPDQPVAAEIERGVQRQASARPRPGSRRNGRSACATSRQSASRISAANCSSCLCESPCRSCGRVDRARAACPSAIPFQDVPGQRFQAVGLRPEAARAPRTPRRSIARPVARSRRRPSSPGKVSLPRSASLPTRLPSGRLVAADVQQVVGDLKGQPEPPAVLGPAPPVCVGVGPGRPAPPAAARPRSSPRSCGGGSIPARRCPPSAAGRRPMSSAWPPTRLARPGRLGQRRAARGGHRRRARSRRPAPRRPAPTGRRRPGWPSPRRTPCGRSAGRGAGRRRPWPAGRRGSANRRGPSRRRRPPAWPPRVARRTPRPPAAPASAAAACPGPAGCSASPRGGSPGSRWKTRVPAERSTRGRGAPQPG